MEKSIIVSPGTKQQALVEKVTLKSKVIAIIIRRDFSKDGIEFFSPKDYSQQLGYMKRPKGYEVQPHIHVLHNRRITLTQETLVVRKGRIRVDFYTPKKKYFKSVELKSGDIILLAKAGHGIEFLEESEIVEIKQGPYMEKEDKIRFSKNSLSKG
jgi:hypothetical protein